VFSESAFGSQWDEKYNANEILTGDKSLISQKWDETYQGKMIRTNENPDDS